MSHLIIYIDGASRGNPGPAAVGVIAKTPDGKRLDAISANIGEATNNVAEYQALITALKLALKHVGKDIEIRSDSELLIKQMTGKYRIKSARLRKLAMEAMELVRQLGSVRFTAIPRTKNKEADKLANEALDDAMGIIKPSIKVKKPKGRDDMETKEEVVLKVGYSFDDILLEPLYSEVLPHDTDLSVRLCADIVLNIPILSSAMDTVTESRMAIALAQQGALGVIHRNMSPERQAAEVVAVKRAESVTIRDPITIPPTITVGEAVAIMNENNITGLPVVEGGKLVGILTSRDIRFEPDTSRNVTELMTTKLITMKEGEPLEKAAKLLHKNRIEKILVVDEAGLLTGLITAKDLQKKKEHPQAVVDDEGHLLAAAAVGVGSNLKERARLLAEAGVDIFAVDTAHGDSKNVVKAVEFLKAEFSDIPVIAGNIATPDGAERLAKAGADAVKVGVGPGSICTTRVITGAGVPQASAIAECFKLLNKLEIPLIADGGIRYSGDATKAFALGASAIMLGNMFAGTDEALGETVLLEGRRFKVYRGMGSIGAMKEGARDRYMQEHITEIEKMVPEGIEGRVPYRGPVADVVYQIVGGVRAGMGMVGAANIPELWKKARFRRVTLAGLQESHPHSVTITKEAPNYMSR